MRRIFLLLAACIVSGSLEAAPVPPAARAEIDALLARLETSSCQFERNGTWHTAAEAKSHLLRKLEYLEAKGAVQSAEQFIERAASGSSLSGQPYRVRCGNGEPVPSGKWLSEQLRAIRSPGRTGGAR